MELNVKTYGTAIITLIIAVVMVAAFLIPTLNDVQKEAGDPVTLSNQAVSDLRYGFVDGFEFVIDQDAGTITYNGEEVEIPETGWRLGYYVNNGWGQITSDAVIFNANLIESAAASNQWIGFSTGVWSVKAENGTLTITKPDTTTIARDYEWAMAPTEGGSYAQIEDWDNSLILPQSYTLDLICIGLVTDPAVAYTYYHGVTTIQDGYDGNLAYSGTLVDGTTDLYQGGMVLNMDIDGTPTTKVIHSALAKAEVSGHKDSGANYSLIGVIPLIVLAGLVISVAAGFIARRD